MRSALWYDLAFSGLLALGLAACNGDSTGSNGGGLSAAQANEIGSANEDELESSIGSITLDGAFGTVGLSAPAPASGVSASIAALPAGCPAVDNLTDTDGDGIPDDATFTFTNPPCGFTGWRGGSVGLTGQVEVVDPSPNAFDFTATLTDLAFSYTAPGNLGTYTASRNGTRSRTGSAGGASVSEDIITVRQRPNFADATLHKVGTVTFTPDQGFTLALRQPLPSGNFSLNGTLTWNRGQEDFTFVFTTPTALHYNSTCTNTPQRIDSGELDVAGTVNGIPGTLKVVWSACGQEPTRTWTVGPVA